MEGLRGLAVALVFGVHYATLVQPWLPPAGWQAMVFDTMHRVGHAGVDLFFVLSGLLIYGHLLKRSQPFHRYFARRLRRIYPAFLAVFALYLALSLLLPGRSKLPGGPDLVPYLLANLLLLPGMLPIEPLITVAWSLSYEMFFYLVMPALVGLFALRARSAPVRIGLLCLLLSLALAGFALLGGPVRLCMFLFGALLSEALARPWRPAAWAGALAGLVGLAAMLVPAPGAVAQALRTALLGLCFGLLCLAAIKRPASALAGVLGWRPLRWLGNMSYSYYLIHGLSLHVFFAVLARLPNGAHFGGVGVAMLAPAFLLSLVFSASLFLCVERPFSLVVPSPRRSGLRPEAL
jgi:exopolysaccharide production protein ExoZ